MIKRLPIAKELGETNICFLIHPTIPEDIMLKYGKIVRDIILQASI